MNVLQNSEQSLRSIFASLVDPRVNDASRNASEMWLQTNENAAAKEGKLAMVWTQVLSIATTIHASSTGIAFSITSSIEIERLNTIGDNEAVSLSAAVWLKHSIRRILEQQGSDLDIKMDWSTASEFEGYVAIAALMEPSSQVGRQLELVLANLVQGYFCDYGLESTIVLRTLLALALHCTGNSVPNEWQLRAWGGHCVTNAHVAERALRCLKHCLRGWAQEAKRTESFPLNIKMQGDAHNNTEDPSHGIARLRAMAIKAREQRESREKKVLSYLSSELLPITAQAWLQQHDTMSPVLNCRWLRILSTAITIVGTSIKFLQRSSLILSRDATVQQNTKIQDEDTKEFAQSLNTSLAHLIPEIFLRLAHVAATNTINLKYSVLAADCLGRFLESGVFATEMYFTQFAQAVAKSGLILSQALTNQSYDNSSPKHIVAIIVALAKLLLLEDDVVVSTDEKPKHHDQAERDAVEILCESATSLDISSKPTSGGGESYQAQALTSGLEQELGRITTSGTNKSQNDSTLDKSAQMVAAVANESGLIDILVRKYLGATPKELEAYCNGNGESIYVRECHAVGSASSWSWKASNSLFSSIANRELSRDAPSLMEHDDDDAWATDIRPASEALLVALCMRHLPLVARGVLQACEAMVNASGEQGTISRYAALEAAFRAVGLVAPFLSSSAQQQYKDSNAFASLQFDELWHRHLEPALHYPTQLSYPNSPRSFITPGEAMVRSRCLWLVARCRRSVLFRNGSSTNTVISQEEEKAQFMRRVIEIVIAHANPLVFNEPRLVLAAIDASASLLETALERHRAVLLYFERLTDNNSSYARDLVDKSAAVIDIVRDFAPTIAERAVACVSSQLTHTPEGILRCLQCTALCLEVAALTGLQLDNSNRMVRLALATAVASEVSERLVPRVWGMLNADSYAGLKLRTAVFVLLTNALKASRRLACLEAVIPLRRLSVQLVTEVLLHKEKESLLYDPLAEDALALWLETLRAEDNQPGTLEGLTSLFTRVFAESKRWGSEHALSMLDQIQDDEALVKALAGFYQREDSACDSANNAPLTSSEEMTQEEMANIERIQTGILAIAQAELLRGPTSPQQRQLCAYVALSFVAEQRARERSRELRYLAPSLSFVLRPQNDSQGETAALAALVLTELLFQTGKIEAASMRTLRLVSNFPERHIPGVHNARIVEVRLSLVSRAIIAVNGDICFLGLNTDALSQLCIHAAKKNLDDLTLAAGTQGASPPPQRAILASLAAAATLASSNQASVDCAWACLPSILRLWARCLFDFKRAAQRSKRRHSDGGDTTGHGPSLLYGNSSSQQRFRALASFRLPVIEYESEESNIFGDATQRDRDKPIDAISTATQQLQRSDVIHRTALDVAARHALSIAAPSRGGYAALRQAAQTVTPDDLRNLLLSILLVPSSSSNQPPTSI